MKSFEEWLDYETRRYGELLERICKRDLDEPEGFLSIAKKEDHFEYYHVHNSEEGKSVRRYISKDKMDLACSLASRAYYRKMKSVLSRRMKQLSALQAEFREDEIDRVYLDLPQKRRDLVEPIEPTYEHRLANWKAEIYEGRAFSDDNVIMTNRGERVRSKSEKILADLFDRYRIEYKYERPLKMMGRVIFPDFTILVPAGGEIYWEHFGMMDSPDYVEIAIKKIIAYQVEGMYLGDRLLVSFETAKSTIDLDYVHRLIRRYLLTR